MSDAGFYGRSGDGGRGTRSQVRTVTRRSNYPVGLMNLPMVGDRLIAHQSYKHGELNVSQGKVGTTTIKQRPDGTS